ncbi:ATP-binding response regulator [Massilia pseudoviolaceinigra]|uniref:ATP-binding response regulator n=1 Tax=Massilia pseudoviolaceinigra TaxID=3057165 RepID=UPI002796D6E9|nr:hybrid sensor histidine kinase/response regulator [Massilia sp. CCM 9206]MDQ1919284.1 hybrid sensor histidine kinase/response regulator [Massilia sp. CCM 9206]
MTSEVRVATAHSLEAELLRLLARQGRRVPIPVFLGAVMIAALAWGRVPTVYLGAWLLLVALVLTARWLILGRLPALANLSDARRLHICIALSALNGCTHALSLLFFTALPEFQRAIQSLLLVGLCAGSVATTAGYRPVFLAFLLPVMAPLVAQWALMGHGGWIGGATALILALFGAVLIALASDSFRLFRESFEIRLQQASLNAQLKLALSAAEAANRAKTRFLASASHDLRQPVHALSLFAGALAMQPLDDDSRDIARHMGQAIQTLSGQLDALLDVSKLDAGIVQVRPAELELAPFLACVYDEYLPAAQARGLQLTLECDCAPLIVTDEVLLGRLVCNLVDNAIKYTTQGSVSLSLSGQGGQVVMAVVDSGSGIPLAEHDRVFEEFYQIGNSERDQSKGLGLGLSIVRRLADLLRMRLEMVSFPGTGTSFYLVCEQSGQQGTGARPAAAPAAPIPGRHVLVVDDDASVRAGMQALLHGLGAQVTLAGSTAEALAAVVQRCPDMLLVDFRLRDGDNGLATVAALRQLYPALPAILISGDTAPDRLREANSAGLPLLHKPVAADVLRQAMDDAGALPASACHGPDEQR